MMRRIKTNAKKIVFLLAVFVFLFSFNSSFLKAGDCEKAFFKCLYDPFLVNTLFAPIYCGIGYIFCKKYIEYY